MVEEYEEAIIDWFKDNQHISPLDYVCDQNVLQKKSNGKYLSCFLFFIFFPIFCIFFIKWFFFSECLGCSTEIPDWGIKTSRVFEDEAIYNFRRYKTEFWKYLFQWMDNLICKRDNIGAKFHCLLAHADRLYVAMFSWWTFNLFRNYYHVIILFWNNHTLKERKRNNDVI